MAVQPTDPTALCKHLLLDGWGMCKLCERYNIFDDPAQKDQVQRVRQLQQEAQRRWDEKMLARWEQRRLKLRKKLAG